MLSGAPRAATIRCVTPIEVVVLTSEDLVWLDSNKLHNSSGNESGSDIIKKITRQRSLARVRALLEAAEDCAVMMELEPNEVLFHEGDEARNVYVVKSGLIDIVDEKEKNILVTLKENDLLGETALLLKTTRNATARASAGGKACVLKVDQKRFMNLVAIELRAEIVKSKMNSFDRTMRNAKPR